MPLNQIESFAIGEWQIEPSLNQISTGEQVCKLDPKTMEVLLCLSQKAGEVVRRQELMDAVWGDVVVSENTLTSVIARLRKTMGDDWQKPRYIETISKSGYRLVAHVQVPDYDVDRIPRGDSIPNVSISFPNFDQTRQSVWPRFRLQIVSAAVFALLLAGGFVLFNNSTSSSPYRQFDPQPLVSLNGTEAEPKLSPDGRYLAFMWQGESEDNWDVYIQQIGEDIPVRLTTSSAIEGLPTWSPDGQHLAFVRGDPETHSCSIFRMPLIGGQEQKLADCGQGVRSLDWSADGALIAISGNVDLDSPSIITLVDIDSQVQRVLTQPPEGSLGDRGAIFSPDGESVAFRRRRLSGSFDLFVVAVEGGDPVQLTADAGRTVSGVDWTPDGKALLFSSNRDGEYRLWSIPAAGGTPTRVPINDIGLTAVHHSASTGRLAYRTVRDETDMWRLEMIDRIGSFGEPTMVLSSSREELYPQYSPDGDRIAFVSKRSGFHEIWTGNVDGSDLMRHSDFRGAEVGPPRWSPDGETIIFHARPNGQADLFMVSANNDLPRQLTDTSQDEVNGRFSRDGNWLYYSTNSNGVWEIWRMSTVNSSSERLIEQGGFDVQESADREMLYYTRADTTGLWVTAIDGGNGSQLFDDLATWDWGNWAVTESGVYFVQQSTKAVAFHSFDSGDTLPIYLPSKTVSFIGPALSISPDASSLVWSQIERSDDEIMLVDIDR